MPESCLPRREFLRITQGFAIGGAFINLVWIDGAQAAIPASQGYLLVDTKKCQGCLSCMLACSLIHEGIASLSQARIQVLQNSFEKWPDDITIEQCRQCPDAPCEVACPARPKALIVDRAHGNVRWIDPERCTGCGMCVEKCPHAPRRLARIMGVKREAGSLVQKCDLCAHAPHHWDPQGGGPAGKQACVAVCPVGAIAFSAELPEQAGDAGYKVNLRDANWGRLGFPTE